MHWLLSPRSLLFVPAGDERKIRSAAAAGADAIVLDLEDAILPERKQSAREQCGIRILREKGLPQAFVRINSPRSEWFEGDLNALAEIRPDGVVVPKCESAQDLR